MAKLFLVINEDSFLLSHRRELAERAIKEGYEVTVVCKDTGHKQELLAMGLHVVDSPVNPTGMNPRQELRTLLFLYRLFRKERPDLVHNVGPKGILWGGLAARLARVSGVVNAVSGLGTLFNGEHPSLMARAVMQVLRFNNHRDHLAVIFQNHDDEGLFLKYHVVKPSQCVYIKGSGVNLSEYAYSPK